MSHIAGSGHPTAGDAAHIRTAKAGTNRGRRFLVYGCMRLPGRGVAGHLGLIAEYAFTPGRKGPGYCNPIFPLNLIFMTGPRIVAGMNEESLRVSIRDRAIRMRWGMSLIIPR